MQKDLFEENWAKVLQQRHVPELTFIIDSSIEYSVHISEKIKELHEKKR